MSTLAYAALTTRRQESTPTMSMWASATDPANTKAGKPGVGAWLDTVAALVPAEVLAANAFLIQLVTKSSKDSSGGTSVAISNPTDAKILFWTLFAVAPLIYILAHLATWDRWDWLRVLIPPGAFVLWSTLQSGTAFTAVAHWSEFTRYLVGVIGVTLLAAIARQLAYKADAS